MRPKIREAIVVEGRYDKNTLSQVVDAAIFEIHGFGIFKDQEMVTFLRRVAEERGLIVFTDSDGAGFVIRNRLKSLIPGEHLLHAYSPEIPGKEKRKTAPSKAGLLGVEGMTPDVILESLRRSGATFIQEDRAEQASISRQDLYRLGLMGGPDSAAMRNRVKEQLALPGQLGTSGFLDALNFITDLAGLEGLLQE